MKTILRKLYLSNSEYYAVIDHDLEYFKLRILKPYEMTAHEDSASYRVNRGVIVPSYVSSIITDNEDIMSTDYTIKDCNNIFINLYESLLEYNPIDILKDYPEYSWVFNKESIYLEHKINKNRISIFEPFDYWKGNQPEDNRLFYHISDISCNNLVKKLIGKSDKPLINVNLNMYSYPIFRTVWYDTLIYTEYVMLQLRALNTVYRLFSRTSQPPSDIIILNEPVQRSSSDIVIDAKIGYVEHSLSRTNGLTEMYNVLKRYDNSKLSSCYVSVLKELSFKTETEIDWSIFEEVYTSHINKYVLAIIMYIRWNFIRSMVMIPESFNSPLCIQTPLGNLVIKGGEPLWEAT